MDDLEARMDRIERKLDALLAHLKAGASTTGPRAARSGPAGGGADLAVASDADLDGPRGDPEVRFVPKRWTGADYKGRHYSECEPEFLDMLADAYEWFAQRDDESGAVDKNGEPKSRWSRLDGSRARGWAARLRAGGGRARTASANVNGTANGAGRRGAPVAVPASDDGDEDIPF